MDTINQSPEPSALPRRRPLPRGAMITGALAAMLVAGAALGAGGVHLAQNWQPQRVMLLQPAPIDKMAERSPVAIKGDVAEIFGNTFIVQDGSGRALVDTGPRGENRPPVAKGETVSVQGRFDRGIVHAEIVGHADGRNDAFGPPEHGPKGPADGGPKGPGPKDAPLAPPRL